MAGGSIYRCEATSVEGFVQQLAVSYVRNGYFFYVTGTTREGKDPRNHRPEAHQPLRRGRLEVHAGPEEEGRRRERALPPAQAVLRAARDLRPASVLRRGTGCHPGRRETPIKYDGYAVSYRAGHACVRIDRGTELNMKAYFADIATKQSAANISRQFRRLPFQPYAPFGLSSSTCSGTSTVGGRRRASRRCQSPPSAGGAGL